MEAIFSEKNVTVYFTKTIIMQIIFCNLEDYTLFTSKLRKYFLCVYIS